MPNGPVRAARRPALPISIRRTPLRGGGIEVPEARGLAENRVCNGSIFLADRVECVTVAAAVEFEVDHETTSPIDLAQGLVEPALKGRVDSWVESAAQCDLADSVAGSGGGGLLDGAQFGRRETMLHDLAGGDDEGIDVGV
uniref:Uncharacterized protein n=1 Tax=uncultured marine microorganism HF4000_ANIW141C7 TaxID=455536 RepID=B3T5B2_9ZZZZ|nr:hypothetical protein ALOHA_HF4000ANIW141C7ctg1g5 [uncultured marine microorganism HF4000_ANIW141C7]